MSDINRLPARYKDSFRRFASASDAVLNMATLLRPDYHTVYTHFLGDALPGEWNTAATNGTSAAVTVASSRLTMTSGTNDDGYAGQAFGLHWKGDQGMYFTSEQQLNTLTTSKIEVGITDAIADAGAVATKATPTGTADDFIVLVRDTDDNTDLDLISELDNGGPAANAEGVYTVAAATNFLTEFRYQNDAAAVYVNGSHVGSGACQGGDLVTPWWFCQSRAGSASRIFVVEWAFVTGPSGI